MSNLSARSSTSCGPVRGGGPAPADRRACHDAGNRAPYCARASRNSGIPASSDRRAAICTIDSLRSTIVTRSDIGTTTSSSIRAACICGCSAIEKASALAPRVIGCGDRDGGMHARSGAARRGRRARRGGGVVIGGRFHPAGEPEPMNLADHGVSGQPAADRGGNLTCALAVEPHLSKLLDLLVGPGHQSLVSCPRACKRPRLQISPWQNPAPSPDPHHGQTSRLEYAL